MSEGDRQRVIDVVNIKCQCCGKMIPGKLFIANVQDREMRFCTEDCYVFYLDYFLGTGGC